VGSSILALFQGWDVGSEVLLEQTHHDFSFRMEDRETPRMHKYGESKETRIMMATVRHVTSSLVLRKFQTA